jgi:hypothetical protein
MLEKHGLGKQKTAHYKKEPFCLLSSAGCRRPSSFPVRPLASDFLLTGEIPCYSVDEVEYAAARLTPHRGLIAGDSEAQQLLSQSRRRSEEAFSPRRPKISPLLVNYYSLMITMDSIGYLYITGASL